MSAIDWRALLHDNSIPFIERGANVKRGGVNIRCPFCGSADPSFHMGLNLTTGYWGCWRNSDHRGKSPLRLIVQLLGISYAQARKMAGLGESYSDPDGFSALADRLIRASATKNIDHIKREFLAMPREFRQLEDLGSGRRFFHYLAWDRNFGMHGTGHLGGDYGVKYCFAGDFRNRVILPYQDEDGSLVAWTGRAIGNSPVRYRDLEHDDCLVEPKNTLFNLGPILNDSVMGHTLVLCEGPIDALKLDVFGRHNGVRAVALSTNSISDAQLYLVSSVAPLFDRLIVMMDTSTQLGVVSSMRMKSQLAGVNMGSQDFLSIANVPFGLKDAGEMSPRQVHQWTSQIKGNP